MVRSYGRAHLSGWIEASGPSAMQIRPSVVRIPFFPMRPEFLFPVLRYLGVLNLFLACVTLLIPHSVRRFSCGEKDSHDSEHLKKYIYGGHVGEYMEAMEEDDAEKYAKHFARYIEADVTIDNMEETWEKVYDAIRKDPTHQKSDRKKPAKCLKRKAKLNASQRQDRVNQKMRSFAKKNE